MLTTLLLLAAGTAAAPTPIETFAQVRELCSALRTSEAAPGLYRVEVPSKGFVLGRYRAHEEELELDGARPMRAAGGALLLDLEQADRVAFHAPAAAIEQWKADKTEGNLTLSIVFEPSADGCSGHVHTRQLRLAGSARSWKLLGPQGKLLAVADEEARPVLRAEGPRSAKVQSVALEGEAPREDDGRSRLAKRQTALDECTKGASNTGPVVLSFAAKAGQLADVQVALDGLHDEAVAGCIAKAVSGAALADGASGRGTATITVE